MKETYLRPSIELIEVDFATSIAVSGNPSNPNDGAAYYGETT